MATDFVPPALLSSVTALFSPVTAAELPAGRTHLRL